MTLQFSGDGRRAGDVIQRAATGQEQAHSERRALFGIMFFACVLQYVASLLQPRPNYFWMTDSPAYWGNAVSLAATGRLNDVFFPLGTSLFLSPFAALEVPPFSVVLYVHPVLHALNAACAYAIVRPSCSRLTAVMAALGVASYLPLINYARQLISEPWFVTTLLGGLCLLLRQGRAAAFASGCLFGFATLVRTPGLGIVALMPFAMLAVKRSRSEILAFVAGAFLVIAAGVGLASISAGKFVFLTSGVSMAATCRSVWGGYRFVPTSIPPETYLQRLITQPMPFLWERLCAFLNIVSPWPIGDDRSFMTKLVIFMADIPILVLTGFSFRKWVEKRRIDDSFLLLVPAMGLVGFYTLFFAINRYRMPYFPALLCMSVRVLWPNRARATIDAT